MKKHIYKIVKFAGVFLAAALILASCDTWIDTDVNVNPDAPADVPMNLMLPAIQQNIGYTLGGNDMVLTTDSWMQQFDGVSRQSYTVSRYQYLPGDVNNLWNTIYSGVLINSKILINKAENTEGKYSPYNAGIGKVLMATSLGVATDLFGDMPYSDALKGNENVLTPKFDTQEQVYTALQGLLDGAITDLGKTADENLVAVKVGR